MTLVVDASTLSSETERLTGVSADEQLDGLDVPPVDLFDVAVIESVRPSFSKDAAGVSIRLGMPDSLAHAAPFQTESQPVDTRTDRPDMQAQSPASTAARSS